VIRLEGVGKTYGAIRALQDIDLEIDCGVFGLLGPNGAGKTTLIRIVATILPPTSGSASLFGIDLLRNPMEARKILGYLPQDNGAYPRLSGREYLEYIALLKHVPKPNRQIEDLLHRFNLADVGGRRLRGYSGGMLRRIGIAQALLGDPKVLLVDEPTSGLDPEERARFRDLLMELGSGRSVILSTHLVEDIAMTCDRLAILHGGCLRFHGSPQELVQTFEGKITEIVLREEDVQEHLSSWGDRILSTQRTIEGRTVRVLGDVDGGHPVSPSLEDAYLGSVRP